MDELDVIDVTSGDNTPAPVPNATAVLVLGIISIVGCFLYAIPGIVCSIIALVLHKRDKALYLANPVKYENSFKTSKAGHICAIIGLSLSLLFIVILIIYFVFIFSVVAGAMGRMH